jgi:hypothetical protein
MLQDDHGGGLVDHRAPLGTLLPPISQDTLGRDRRHALVDESDRDRSDCLPDLGGVLPHLGSRRALAS